MLLLFKVQLCKKELATEQYLIFIPTDCAIENKYKVDDSVWVMKEGKPQKLEVMAVYVKKDEIYYSLRKRSSWKGEEYKESDCFSSKEEIAKLM